jgi:hypothetical protein
MELLRTRYVRSTFHDPLNHSLTHRSRYQPVNPAETQFPLTA